MTKLVISGEALAKGAKGTGTPIGGVTPKGYRKVAPGIYVDPGRKASGKRGRMSNAHNEALVHLLEEGKHFHIPAGLRGDLEHRGLIADGQLTAEGKARASVYKGKRDARKARHKGHQALEKLAPLSTPELKAWLIEQKREHVKAHGPDQKRAAAHHRAGLIANTVLELRQIEVQLQADPKLTDFQKREKIEAARDYAAKKVDQHHKAKYAAPEMKVPPLVLPVGPKPIDLTTETAKWDKLIEAWEDALPGEEKRKLMHAVDEQRKVVAELERTKAQADLAAEEGKRLRPEEVKLTRFTLGGPGAEPVPPSGPKPEEPALVLPVEPSLAQAPEGYEEAKVRERAEAEKAKAQRKAAGERFGRKMEYRGWYISKSGPGYFEYDRGGSPSKPGRIRGAKGADGRWTVSGSGFQTAVYDSLGDARDDILLHVASKEVEHEAGPRPGEPGWERMLGAEPALVLPGKKVEAPTYDRDYWVMEAIEERMLEGGISGPFEQKRLLREGAERGSLAKKAAYLRVLTKLIGEQPEEVKAVPEKAVEPEPSVPAESVEERERERLARVVAAREKDVTETESSLQSLLDLEAKGHVFTVHTKSAREKAVTEAKEAVVAAHSALAKDQPALVFPEMKSSSESVPATPPTKPRRSYQEMAEEKLGPPPEGKGLVDVSDDDIPWRTAQAAYEGTSQSPEDRAARERRDYVQTIRDAETRLAKYATTPEKIAEAQGMLQRFKEGYKKKLMAYLGSRSGFYSSFISGASNYPAQRMKKKHRIIDNRLEEKIKWRDWVLDKMTREISESGSVKATDPGGVDKLQGQIDELVDRQKTMKAANKIVRKKGLSKEQKIEQLQAMGYKGSATALLESDFAGRLGFPGYELTSVNEKIKRLKERQGLIIREQSHETAEHAFEGGTVVDNAEDDRVQIFFDSKPNEEMRSKLKGRGFRWVPSIGSWQRQRTDAARAAVKHVLGLELPVPERTEKSLSASGLANLDMEGWLTHHAEDSPL